MPTVTIAPSLARWIDGGSGTSSGERRFDVAGETLREVLEATFSRHPNLRGYVADEHGRIRHHVVIFLDNEAIPDKSALDTPLTPQSEVALFQALSGG
jgi:sulfur-carrier protein